MKRKHENTEKYITKYFPLKDMISYHLIYDDILPPPTKKQMYVSLIREIRNHIVCEDTEVSDNISNDEKVLEDLTSDSSMHFSCPAYFSEVDKVSIYSTVRDCAYCECFQKRDESTSGVHFSCPAFFSEVVKISTEGKFRDCAYCECFQKQPENLRIDTVTDCLKTLEIFDENDLTLQSFTEILHAASKKRFENTEFSENGEEVSTFCKKEFSFKYSPCRLDAGENVPTICCNARSHSSAFETLGVSDKALADNIDHISVEATEFDSQIIECRDLDTSQVNTVEHVCTYTVNGTVLTQSEPVVKQSTCSLVSTAKVSYKEKSELFSDACEGDITLLKEDEHTKFHDETLSNDLSQGELHMSNDKQMHSYDEQKSPHLLEDILAETTELKSKCNMSATSQVLQVENMSMPVVNETEFAHSHLIQQGTALITENAIYIESSDLGNICERNAKDNEQATEVITSGHLHSRLHTCDSLSEETFVETDLLSLKSKSESSCVLHLLGVENVCVNVMNETELAQSEFVVEQRTDTVATAVLYVKEKGNILTNSRECDISLLNENEETIEKEITTSGHLSDELFACVLNIQVPISDESPGLVDTGQLDCQLNESVSSVTLHEFEVDNAIRDVMNQTECDKLDYIIEDGTVFITTEINEPEIGKLGNVCEKNVTFVENNEQETFSDNKITASVHLHDGLHSFDNLGENSTDLQVFLDVVNESSLIQSEFVIEQCTDFIPTDVREKGELTGSVFEESVTVFEQAVEEEIANGHLLDGVFACDNVYAHTSDKQKSLGLNEDILVGVVEHDSQKRECDSSFTFNELQVGSVNDDVINETELAQSELIMEQSTGFTPIKVSDAEKGEFLNAVCAVLNENEQTKLCNDKQIISSHSQDELHSCDSMRTFVRDESKVPEVRNSSKKITRSCRVMCTRLEEDEALSEYWGNLQSVHCNSTKNKGIGNQYNSHLNNDDVQCYDVKSIKIVKRNNGKKCRRRYRSRFIIDNDKRQARVLCDLTPEDNYSKEIGKCTVMCTRLEDDEALSCYWGTLPSFISKSAVNERVGSKKKNQLNNDKRNKYNVKLLNIAEETEYSHDYHSRFVTDNEDSNERQDISLYTDSEDNKKKKFRKCAVMCSRPERMESLSHYSSSLPSITSKSAMNESGRNQESWELKSDVHLTTDYSDDSDSDFCISLLTYSSTKRKKLSLSSKSTLENSVKSLDQILREHQVESQCQDKISEVQAALQSLDIGENSLEVSNDQELALPNEIASQSSLLRPIRITSNAPGLQVFDLERAFCLFDLGCLELAKDLESHPLSVSALEEKLRTVPVAILLNVIGCQGFETCSFAQLSEKSLGVFLHFLWRVSAVHEQHSIAISSQRLINLILSKTQIDWCPSLINIMTILINFGAVEGSCPLPNLYLLSKDKFHTSEEVKPNSTASLATSDFFTNLRIVLQTLATFMNGNCSYSATECADLVLLLCWIALDSHISNSGMKVDISLCVKEALDKIQEDQWTEKLEYLCQKLVELGDHHHNIVCIAQNLPPNSRGTQLQRCFSFFATQKLIGEEPVFKTHVTPLVVLECLHVRKLHIIDDHYLLYNIFMLVNMSINTRIQPEHKKSLNDLLRFVMETYGKIQESCNYLESSCVKNLLVEMRTKWMFLLGKLNKTSMFLF